MWAEDDEEEEVDDDEAMLGEMGPMLSESRSMRSRMGGRVTPTEALAKVAREDSEEMGGRRGPSAVDMLGNVGGEVDCECDLMGASLMLDSSSSLTSDEVERSDEA